MKGEEIFMWSTITIVIIIIVLVLGYILIRNPALVILTGGLDVIPVSEPPIPVGLTYACQTNQDCKSGLTCDPYDFTCRMSYGSPCYQASDCVSGLVCSGTCEYPANVDLNQKTFVDGKYICSNTGIPCGPGATKGSPMDPNGIFCCRACTVGESGCTPGTTCGVVTSDDGYTLSCSTNSRSCPCKQGKQCVPKYGSVDGIKECRVSATNPCVCNEDCVTRSCIYYSGGTTSSFPVGICREPLGNGQYCTVNEGCISDNCSLTYNTYGYCQPKGIQNGGEGASCNVTFEPQCNTGLTCNGDHICTAPTSYGLNHCDSNTICADSFFCGMGVTGPDISINICDGSTNCLCLYGNKDANSLPNNTIPMPNTLSYLTSNCIPGNTKIISGTFPTCIPTVEAVLNTDIVNSAPCINSNNCSGGTCVKLPAIYRLVPVVTSEFPIQGLQGLNGLYYERIPFGADTFVSKVIGVSKNWSIEQEVRGQDTLFFIDTNHRIFYKNLTNGNLVLVDNQFVMDSGSPENQDGIWTQIIIPSGLLLLDADAYWSNGIYKIYFLVQDTVSLIYSIRSVDPNTMTINGTITVPVNVIWSSISCSDYSSVIGGSSILIKSLHSGSRFTNNATSSPVWTSISTSYDASLGYGIYNNSSDTYYSYPVYGQTTSGYFIQPNIYSPSRNFSTVRYPQNTYINNINATSTGNFTNIVPPTGSNVSSFSILNVNMKNSTDEVKFLHFAYIAKWGTDPNYYVYYVGTGFSLALPGYINQNSKVVITPGNLYIYSESGCI